MKTFFHLLQKCIKSEKIIYPDDPFEIYYRSYVNKEYHDVYLYINNIISEIHYTLNNSQFKNRFIMSAHIKFFCLKRYLDNVFISNELKEKILNIFSKAQRAYIALSKFANLYKYKKYPLVVTNDLTLNPLDIEKDATFIMIQDKSKYLFSMNDLINIIETAICNAPSFFLKPLSPKNPYNNQKLNTSTLCNIYFKMKYSNCKFSLIIHLFFLECFVKHNFFINNEAFLREYAIKKYVYTTPSKTLYNYVINMLDHYCYDIKKNIHEDFPKDLLVNIFKPYLFYYYIINYNIKGIEKNTKCKTELYNKLNYFNEYNKLFGRKICNANKINLFKSDFSIDFNTKHINFYDIPNTRQIHNSKFRHININNDYDPDEMFYNYFNDTTGSNQFNLNHLILHDELDDFLM